MNKINLPDVTLVAVAGVRVPEAYKAIRKSMKGINFGEVKLITPKNAVTENKEVQVIKLDYELNYEAYNRFIVYNLKDYIDTEYVLLVQDDGYVCNPKLWKDEFYDYDYIGAIWPIPDESDKISYRDPFGKLIRVGNGGFSFRSKKLLNMPTELDLPWKSYYDHWNEDGFISVHNRHFLEEKGIKYAPIDIAKYFSHESPVKEIEGLESFGFHGKNSKHYLN